MTESTSQAAPEPEPSSAPESESTLPKKRRRRINAAGAPNTKGGKEVTRQNFSMHPDLMKAILLASTQLGGERAQAIIDDRAKRITYSKIVAAFAWLLKTRYMTPDEEITPQLRQLIADFEASPFERPDDSPHADQIMEERRLYASSLSQDQGDAVGVTDADANGEEAQEERQGEGSDA